MTQRMTAAGGGRRMTRRSRLEAALAIAGLVVAGAVAVPQVAYAADGPFTIDGTVPDANTTGLPDPFGNVKELGPKPSVPVSCP